MKITRKWSKMRKMTKKRVFLPHEGTQKREKGKRGKCKNNLKT